MKNPKRETRPLGAYLPSASVAKKALRDAKRRVEELAILAEAAEKAEQLRESEADDGESGVSHE